jgi:hypothetical protein
MNFKIAKYVTLTLSMLGYCLVATAQTTTTTVESVMQGQIDACNKNTAMTWSSELNRCVGKVEARAQRNDAKACNELKDKTEREQCHLKLAEKNTGMNSDVNSLNQGNIDKSAIMNGVGTAYSILGMINSLGSGKTESQCTSKKIFGYTAMAGTVTDIWLKIKAKKAMDSLIGKYKLENSENPYNAQVMALHYLKEEQQTVADIASREKKRNLLLMIGYGAATAMAVYEMATIGTLSAHCLKPEPKKPAPDKVPDCPNRPDNSCLKAAAATGTQETKTVTNQPAPPATEEKLGHYNEGEFVGPPEAPKPAPAPSEQAQEPLRDMRADENGVGTPICQGSGCKETTGAKPPQGVSLEVDRKSATNTHIKIPASEAPGGRALTVVGTDVLDGKKVVGTLDTNTNTLRIYSHSNPNIDGPLEIPVNSIKIKNNSTPIPLDSSTTIRTAGFDYGSKVTSGSANTYNFTTNGKVQVTSPSGTSTFKTNTGGSTSSGKPPGKR